jgi:hypothetical protein
MMRSSTIDDEQWMLDGICGKCRKNNYCNTPCSANKKRVDRIVEDAVLLKMYERTGVDVGKVFNKNKYSGRY